MSSKPKYNDLLGYKRTKAALATELGREPSEIELEAELGRDVGGMENVEIDAEEEASVELKFHVRASNMNLVNARQDMGLLQKDVAERCGFSKQMYGRYEQCRELPNKERMEKIAGVLGKKVEYLFPPWLEIFTQRWVEAEKEKTVYVTANSLTDARTIPLLEPPHETMVRSAEQLLLKTRMLEAVKQLSPRERKILDLRFGLTDGKAYDLDDVAKMFDVTRERIRQIEAKAIEKLRYMKIPE